MKVFEDMVKGGVSISLSDGAVVKRVFIVSEIEGNRNSIIFNGVTAGQLPKNGEPHPSIPLIRVFNIDGFPKDSNIVEVVVSYKLLPAGESPPDEESETQITLGATVQSVLTNKHVVGKKQKLMILKYIYPLGKSPDGVDNQKEVVPTATKEQASVVAGLSRQESTNPLDKAAKFVGTLNKKKFLGTKKKTWLCTKITGVSSDSGLTYKIDYEFQYKSDGWDVDLAFTDEETGRIPFDVETQPEAFKKFQLQETQDFGKLKLENFK